MDIVTYPNNVLRSYATEIRPNERTIEGIEIDALAAMMLARMRAANGVGLAAPQIGIPRRLWVAHLDGKDVLAINPEVSLVPSATDMEDYEGCLSLPGISVLVKRPSSILLTCQHSMIGARYVWQYDGMAARIIQHETDHLSGKLITDKINTLPFLQRFPQAGMDFPAWFIAHRAEIAKKYLVDEVSVDLSHPAIIYRVSDRCIRENL